jgi:hypothetical protein
MRRALVPVLLAYATLLVLSAWPAEVRPAVLDGPAHAARAVLGTVAIRGGMAVFEPAPPRIVRVQRNDCFRVLGLVEGRPPVRLHPRDGTCFTRGVRLRIPPEAWMLRSLHLRTPAPLGQAVVGDRYCHPDGAAAPRFDEIEVLWTQPFFEIETGAEGRVHPILYRWRCRPPALVFERRGPSDAEVERSSAGGAAG